MISLKVADWSVDAREALKKVVDDVEGGIIDLEKQVTASGAMLFEVMSETAGRVGFYVLRIDEMAAGKELVVIAGAGGLKGVDLLAVMLGAIEEQARISGCRWVRIHTNRRGMYKRLPVLGYLPAEVVYRKEVIDVRQAEI